MMFATLAPPQGPPSLPSHKIPLDTRGNEMWLFLSPRPLRCLRDEAIPDQKKAFCQESNFSVGRLICMEFLSRKNEMKCFLRWQNLSLHLSQWLVGFPGLGGCVHHHAQWVVVLSEPCWKAGGAGNGPGTSVQIAISCFSMFFSAFSYMRRLIDFAIQPGFTIKLTRNVGTFLRMKICAFWSSLFATSFLSKGQMKVVLQWTW